MAQEIKQFDLDKYHKEDEIIIYGASAYGEIAYQVLIQNSIVPFAFCDRKRKIGIGNIKMMSPTEVVNHKDASFIIASADAFHEIKSFLEECGCKKIYDMRRLLCIPIDMGRLSTRAKDIYENRENYFDVVSQDTKNAIYFSRVQFVVSERCSLRCRNCSHLMQYYQNPQNIDLEKSRDAFDRFLDAVTEISELRIMGGEPFMNQELHKLIEWYYGNRKIKHLSIYTNGTIPPSEDNIQAIKGKEIRIHISNYRVNTEKILLVTKQLDAAGISYYIREYDSWQDAGDLRKRGYTEDALKSSFAACFERNSYTFFRGRLYRCARSAHGMNLKAIPWEAGDVVDFTKATGDSDGYREQILHLQKKKFLKACDYCNGPNYHEGNIPAGVQAEQPLSF